MLLTVTRLSLSHAGLPSQSVGVWVPPAAGGKRKLVLRGLPRGLLVKGQASCKGQIFLTAQSEAGGAAVVAPTKIRRPISVLHEAKGRRGAAPRLPRAAAAAPQVQATLRW